MIDIFQVFFQTKFFNPANYNADSRNEFHTLKKTYQSNSGYLENDILFLPLNSKDKITVNNTELIVIQENLNVRDKKSNKVFAYQNTKSLNAFSFFKFRKINDNQYEWFIDYELNKMKIGIPKRDNHKIFDLEINDTVRYKINGKSDFTMSGRKERTYHEFDFLIKWKGMASSIVFRKEHQMGKIKTLPKSILKIVDERKVLI